ncbi:hypothetical protein SEA_WILKINS_92 [Mycobacterium phage Wilkins]|nr:hypothetical protein SEA_WILKINS_92 [Mycobacterium phage Wilkins]QOI67142.1 hypothetical protein SEA_TOPGUN_91 [Mycobacterium phage Topgun]
MAQVCEATRLRVKRRVRTPIGLRIKSLDVDAVDRLLAFRTVDTGSRCSRLSVDVRRRYGAFRVEA